MTTTNEVRQAFLEFFAGHDHKVLPSSALIPHNDPTLMFANAGMNQFKNIFTGMEKAPTPPRAATAQKVVRAGGKHNDLDNVGYTARHHTFFEMLGNFSFGDYFKEQAIVHAWELLTKTFGIAPEKLGFTVYHTDDEAFDLWKKITGCDDSRILRIPTKDNFWAMGDTGPCGPCSEIFYDHGAHAAEGSWSLDADGSDQFGDRYIEIWNLVFMQYEQVDANTRIDLPKPSIDTGMGLERIAAVLQGVHNNYDIDVFRALMAQSISFSGKAATSENLASHKVIADHLRSCGFLIADGVLPSNEGRGYVLRRIMRRAMRHVHLLGSREPMMHRLVGVLVHEMGAAYPELSRAQALITETLKQEEERFRDLLDRGLKLLDEERKHLAPQQPLAGGVAFKLYDTYGFPLDLTQDILRGDGLSVDVAGFDAAMQEQRERARAAWKGSGEKATHELWFALREKLTATEFLGYVTLHASAEVLALIKDGAEISRADAGDEVLLVTNQTPFYAESGGQLGDTGLLTINGKTIAQVTDTSKPVDTLFVHHITLSAPLAVGATIDMHIDSERRTRIRANHSATHLLHAALRKHLGEHVTQKGSQVSADRLRFDFSHQKALSATEWQAIEAEVNHFVWQNEAVSTRLMASEDAIKAGAMALFGEKYGDEVRVLTMGITEQGGPYSVELCGGTHVSRMGDIGIFKILSESAIASGVRRIEATTRDSAYHYLLQQEQQVSALADLLKVGAAELTQRVETLQNDRKKLEKELAESKKKLALGSGSSGADLVPETIGEIQFIGKNFQELAPKELRGIAEGFLKTITHGVVAITSDFEGKGSIVVAVSKDLAGQVNAADLVKHAVLSLGGQGGGGKPEMAQGGGPNGDQCEQAINSIRSLLSV
ncbi:MAG: alanine--tRNA ligase [Rickettsiales bacterium]|nr:alanine--tRNA ligase [Rickettsiales bacterium]